MKILKKIVPIIFTIFFVASCGYNPIFSIKNINYQIGKIDFDGNRTIESEILSKFNPYKTNDSNKNTYDLDIKIVEENIVTSRNSQGQAEDFKILLKVNLEVFYKNEIILTKSIQKDENYSNETEKIKLNQIKNKKILNLSEKISEEILILLSLINVKE